MSDIIDEVINDYVSANGGSILKNNEFYDASAPINEGVDKDVGLNKRSDKKSNKIVDDKNIPTNVPLDNMFFYYKESVLRLEYLYHKRITLERKLSK